MNTPRRIICNIKLQWLYRCILYVIMNSSIWFALAEKNNFWKKSNSVKNWPFTNKQRMVLHWRILKYFCDVLLVKRIFLLFLSNISLIFSGANCECNKLTNLSKCFFSSLLSETRSIIRRHNESNEKLIWNKKNVVRVDREPEYIMFI